VALNASIPDRVSNNEGPKGQAFAAKSAAWFCGGGFDPCSLAIHLCVTVSCPVRSGIAFDQYYRAGFRPAPFFSRPVGVAPLFELIWKKLAFDLLRLVGPSGSWLVSAKPAGRQHQTMNPVLSEQNAVCMDSRTG
jgi:hypothetical protein